jgi:hypothetical protein
VAISITSAPQFQFRERRDLVSKRACKIAIL